MTRSVVKEGIHFIVKYVLTWSMSVSNDVINHWRRFCGKIAKIPVNPKSTCTKNAKVRC